MDDGLWKNNEWISIMNCTLESHCHFIVCLGPFSFCESMKNERKDPLHHRISLLCKRACYGVVFIAVVSVVMSTVCPVNQVEIEHFCGRLNVFLTYQILIPNILIVIISLRDFQCLCEPNFNKNFFHFQDYVIIRFSHNSFNEKYFMIRFEYIVQFTACIFLDKNYWNFHFK